MPLAARALDLPPLFRAVALREHGDAFVHAETHATALGAGTLVFVGRFDVAEFAVILEPEETLADARRVFYAGMVALGDTLASLAPPDTPITIAWPDAVEIDGGLVGGGRLAWPQDTEEDAIPAWLVFGAVIRLFSLTTDPGLYPLSTALHEEGFGGIGAERFIESFARHLMMALDRWREGDLAGLIRDYIAKLPRTPGIALAIAPSGDLRREEHGRPSALRTLRSALKTASWLDPTTGAPRR